MRGRAIRAVLGLALLVAAALPAAAVAAPITHPYVTSFGPFQNPQNVTVDQSNGDIYVLDVGAKTVSRFDSSLKAKKFSALNTNVIDGAATFPCAGTPSVNCDQTPFNGFAFETPTLAQVAIDNSGSPLTNGNIYVADSAHRVVDVFAPTGAYLGMLSKTGAAGAAIGLTCGVAVNSSGTLYVSDPAFAKVHRFVPSSAAPTNSDFSSSLAFTTPCQLAFGTAGTAGSFFASKKNTSPVVSKFNSAGTLQYQLPSPSARGIAVDPSNGHVYVTTGAEIAEYDASGAAPVALGSFGSNQITTAGGVAVDAAGRIYASDTVSGKVYVYGPPAAATPPTVAVGPYVPRASARVGLVGYVDAGDLAAGYHFEYGLSDCAASACASIPFGPDAVVAKGIGLRRVSQEVSGLQPGTTYHYRLVATSAAGSAASADGTFTTLEPPTAPQCPNAQLRSDQGSSKLSECRAYELVSAIPPQQRNGAEILFHTQRVRAAVDGSAFEFASLGAAGDVQSTPFTTEYMGVRDPASGWAVHAITPKHSQLPPSRFSEGKEPRFLGEFTPDLSGSIFLSADLLNGEGANVQGLPNFYRRDDLLTPGSGSYQLLSDADSPQANASSFEVWPSFSGASADLSHVVFESIRDLTATATGLGAGQRLYESVDGAVRLVGVLPASEGGGPSIAKAGRGAGSYSPHVVSADGSRVMFTTPPFDFSEKGGTLYMRDDHGTPSLADDSSVKVSASEKTNGAGPGGTDPLGAQPAFYADASTDLGTVFFRSAEALTNDAPTDQPTALKLYRYEAGAPSGAHLTLLSVDQNPGDGLNDGVDGTIGASRDGSYIYFVASNQLVADRPAVSGPRIFVWHQGTVRQVGAINGGVELNRLVGSEGWQFGARRARVSADGEHLIFLTEGSSELAGYGHGTSCPEDTSSACREAYLYSAPASAGGERLQCVSCNLGIGLAAVGNSDFNARDTSTFVIGVAVGDPYLNRALAAGGRLAFFTSEERLSPYDENEKPDVYEFDPGTGGVSLVSGGKPGLTSTFLDASSDGSDVFFMTRDQLLARDGDQVIDVYDARVDGGFAEASVPALAPCDSAAACRPATSTAPAEPTPESIRALPAAKQQRARHKQRAAKKHKRRHRHQKREGRNG